jgi:putative acetyltransferase
LYLASAGEARKAKKGPEDAIMSNADRLTGRLARNLAIRPIELADVPTLLTIIADARREYGLAERGVELLEPSDRAIYSNYHRQRALYFVAVLDGEVVGGAGVAPLSGSDPLTCELQRMYLRADARGRGIGDALLERCLAAAKQFLYVRCYLETVAQMQAAIGFYGRHGFRDLQAPLGKTSHQHNDRWMIRALRASARESIERIPARTSLDAAVAL